MSDFIRRGGVALESRYQKQGCFTHMVLSMNLIICLFLWPSVIQQQKQHVSIHSNHFISISMSICWSQEFHGHLIVPLCHTPHLATSHLQDALGLMSTTVKPRWNRGWPLSQDSLTADSGELWRERSVKYKMHQDYKIKRSTWLIKSTQVFPFARFAILIAFLTIL